MYVFVYIVSLRFFGRAFIDTPPGFHGVTVGGHLIWFLLGGTLSEVSLLVLSVGKMDRLRERRGRRLFLLRGVWQVFFFLVLLGIFFDRFFLKEPRAKYIPAL